MAINPHLDESKIHNFEEMKTLMQFRDGKIIQAGFDVVPYHQKLQPSTPMYFIVTTGQDGSYIAGNYVSRDVLPDFEKWPLTYATLGRILTSCEIDPTDTYEAAKRLSHKTEILAEKWRFAISLFDKLEALDDIKFEYLAWIQLGQQEIFTDKKKMAFAQELNMSSKLLRQVLDDNNLPLGKRHALIEAIIEITGQTFTCNFVDLP